MPETGGLAKELTIKEQAQRDGVYYALFSYAGQLWRVGSLSSAWMADIGSTLTPETVNAAREKSIWINPVAETDNAGLAVMCCGLGSAWPGMGRELYEYFPAARIAMDRIAALADWDILALLEQPDLEEISPTRWQIPYLFMLEYAQWQQLRTLGIMPTLLCGHSLGELIALCLAGVYSLESAWYLLDTRAEHMAELEAKGARQSGMLAVPADKTEIDAILAQWPDLRISNRNTERQFILSGLRSHLLQARKQLRHKRIPAIMLNMDLAFHNPAMRILRGMSLRRLNGLNMRPSFIPVFSCVDAKNYPDSGPAICKRIADLDENTVDWVNLVARIRTEYPEITFLELGPQETLCGITTELAPCLGCIPADRRGHEAFSMRAACARLFALGFLDFQRIAATQPVPENIVSQPAEMPQEKPAPALEGDALVVAGLLAEICHKAIEEIRPEQDLRQDLAIRSSQFPWLMLEAERRLGYPVILENLFRLVTVADLIQFICGSKAEKTPAAKRETRQIWLKLRRPLSRYSFCDGQLAPAPYNTQKQTRARSYLFRRFAINTNEDWRPEVTAWLKKLERWPGEKPYAIAWIDTGANLQAPNIVADLLALEQAFGHEPVIIWKTPETDERFPRFCANSAIYADVFPDPNPQSQLDSSVLQLLRHFSHFKNPVLAGHGANALFAPCQPAMESAQAWLPLSQILETMVLASAVIAPWLKPVGFTDLHFLNFPELPEGITRECAITASSRLSIFQEGVPARLCRASIAVAPLTPTGRKMAGLAPVSDGTCILAAQTPPFPPVWHNRHATLEAISISLENFYNALGMQPEWRFLADITAAADNNAWRSSVTLPALLANTRAELLLTDACLQAAELALALRFAANSTKAAIAKGVAAWHFSAIGFIRFNPAQCAQATAITLEWAISWEDETLLRFDAQARDGFNNLLLTIHNLEFDRIDN